jgi:hypothetical protein
MSDGAKAANHRFIDETQRDQLLDLKAQLDDAVQYLNLRIQLIQQEGARP